MKPILIIAAMPLEVALLEQVLSNTTPTFQTLPHPHPNPPPEREGILTAILPFQGGGQEGDGVICRSSTNSCRKKTGPFDYVEGLIGTLPVLVCAGGIGKINAAAATAALIERHHPGLVINTGCAGAYMGSGLSIGDLAVATNELLGDEGILTSSGWHDMAMTGIPTLERGKRQYFNDIPLSSHAAAKAMQLADCHGVKLLRGRFVTVSTCSGTRQRGEELVRIFGGICENMEGAAVAQVCLRYGVDCLEIRGISNHVDERDMKKWDIPRAVEAAQRFVLKYIEETQKG